MKYKKSIFVLLLAIFLFSITSVCASEIDTPIASEDTSQIGLSDIDKVDEDNLQTSEEKLKLSVDESLSAQIDNDVLGDTSASYSDLAAEINTPGDVILKNKTYTYNAGASTITVGEDGKVIDGNGAVIDMSGSTIQAFKVTGQGVTIKNLTIKNANYNGDGGAIYFSLSGTVENCNFIGNKATSYGGAIHFWNQGTVKNCNFADNSASRDGGAIWMNFGSVENCNFTENSADYGYGGAIKFEGTGTVTNCNFADNSAYRGGAIFSQVSTTADTCIFKTSSDTTNDNIVIRSPTLNVDNFTSVYGSGEKLTLNLTTNSSTPVTNGNISIRVYFKNNDSWVGNYSCLSGEGWTVDLPVGSYYAIFDTEYAKFQPINRTITISPKIQYYINVTSVTSNNKTVNITAKSNIPNDVVQGKLLLLLPNGANITANYAGNETWWAVHTFNDYSVYQVNAAYEGLDDVTVKEGTITLIKEDSTITLNNVVFDYGDSINVTTVGAVGITAKIDGNNVTLVDFTIPLSGFNVGKHTLTVTTIPDGDHNPVTKEVNITVNKVDSTLTVGDIVFDYGSSGFTVVSYTGADGVNASVVGQLDAVVKVNGTNISVSTLDAGTYTLTVTTIADANHNNITKNATITVNKLKTELTGSAITTTYNVNKDLLITLKDSNGKVLSGVNVTVDLNGAKTYTTDNNGQIKVSTKALPAKKYTAKITFNGNTNYDKSTKDVKVTVNKAANPLKVKGKTLKIKFKKLKKKTRKLKVTKIVKFTKKGQGKLTYKKVKGNKKISINKKNGKVTIKKGLKKGTYKVKVKIKAKGNANYKASAFKTITFKIKIK